MSSSRKNSQDQEWVPGQSRAQYERELDNRRLLIREKGRQLSEEEKFDMMSENQRRKSLRSAEDEEAYQQFLKSCGNSYH